MIKQGDVFIVDLDDSIGHEQKGTRPIIIIQNNFLNQTSDNVVVVPLTSQRKKFQPFHYTLYQEDYPFLNRPKNIVLAECVTCISKQRLKQKIGSVNEEDLQEIFEVMKYLWLEK